MAIERKLISPTNYIDDAGIIDEKELKQDQLGKNCLIYFSEDG
jgi:hypothetical protein